MADESLVAALRLLLSNYERHEAFAAVHDAMTLPERERRRLVCTECGSDDLTFQADVSWDSKLNWFHNINTEDTGHCWCVTCEMQSHDSEVAFDYVHENKSPLKPSDDP